ncbi:MAG: cytochrome P450 [Acidimicrobiales bacterium]
MPAPDILSPEYASDPYPLLDELREDYPITFNEGLQSWVLSRYEDVEHALKSPAFTTENYGWQLEPVHGHTILQMEGPDHRRTRGIITPALRGDNLRENFESIVVDNVEALIEPWKNEGHVDLVKQFTQKLPMSVILDILDLDPEMKPTVHIWYNAIHDYFTNISGDEEVAAAGLRVKEELQEYMLPLIQERRDNPGDDLISQIVHAEINGERMSDMEIKSFVSFLLVAGSESTDLQISNMWLRLMENPDQMAAVRADRSLIGSAFAESLRHTPAVLMIMRQASQDVEFHGETVPAGATVTLMLAAANRDPRKFEDPQRFNLFRDELDAEKELTGAASHTTFALGRHFCIGTRLAALEAETATNHLLDVMDNIEFTNGVPPKEEGNFVRAPRTFPLTFTPSG